VKSSQFLNNSFHDIFVLLRQFGLSRWTDLCPERQFQDEPAEGAVSSVCLLSPQDFEAS